MTIETVAFEPDKYFRSTPAQAHLIADAVGIVARQRGWAKLPSTPA